MRGCCVSTITVRWLAVEIGCMPHVLGNLPMLSLKELVYPSLVSRVEATFWLPLYIFCQLWLLLTITRHIHISHHNPHGRFQRVHWFIALFIGQSRPHVGAHVDNSISRRVDLSQADLNITLYQIKLSSRVSEVLTPTLDGA